MEGKPENTKLKEAKYIYIFFGEPIHFIGIAYINKGEEEMYLKDSCVTKSSPPAW